MKTLTLYKYGKAYPMSFETNYYADNGNLYVGLVTHEEGYPEPWSDLTVNLGVKCEPNCAFIDTNNNGSEIIEWLYSNGLGHLTGNMKASGWCVYPEFKFNMDRLKKFMETETLDTNDDEPEFESYWNDDADDNRKGNYSEFGDD